MHRSAAFALLLAACSTQPAATPSATPTRTEASATNTATPPSTPAVPEIWRFEASLVGGGTLDGADFAGDKVAVWLWAPW